MDIWIAQPIEEVLRNLVARRGGDGPAVAHRVTIETVTGRTFVGHVRDVYLEKETPVILLELEQTAPEKTSLTDLCFIRVSSVESVVVHNLHIPHTKDL